ncbi:MAG TPA: glycosyltransferase [Ktedonobacteraceae bacterium]|nr:glycosyltransferase [Ktedonobacteraceae bacterium]
MPDTKTASVAVKDGRSGPLPARVIEIEISQPLPALSSLDEKTGAHYQRAVCLIRLHAQPLGMIDVSFAETQMLPREYAGRIWETFNEQITQHLRGDHLALPDQLDAAGLPFTSLPLCLRERERFLLDAPFVSVIVPTRDHPECLADCLHALVKIDYPHYEILIVDSAPTTTAAADLVAQSYGHDPRIRYLLSERPGASRARNLGILEAKGEILAFTDDDAVVDAHWLTELVRGFANAEKTICVTGSTCTLRLDTLAQLWFVTYFRGLGDRGKMKRIFSPHSVESRMYYKHIMGNMGGSVNMAATAAFLRHIGGFDPALGPGTPTWAAEDAEVFIQANMHGGTFVYQPAALVYHLDRPNFALLEKVIYGYGASVPGVLLASMLCYPQISLHFARHVFSRLLFFVHSNGRGQKVLKTTDPADSGAKWGALMGWEDEKRVTRRVLRQLLRGLGGGLFGFIRSRVIQGNRRTVRSNRKATTPLWYTPSSSLAQEAELRTRSPVCEEQATFS